MVEHIPYITNRFPVHNEPNASATTIIYFDILDRDGDLKQDGLTVWINGDRAFDGYEDSYSFNSPYNTSNSRFYSTTVDGYDGYHIILDSYNSYSGMVSIRTTAEDVALNSFDGYWGFIVQRKINSVYFSDGYGLKKIDIQELVGEAQSSSKPLSGSDEKIPNFTRVKIVISTSSSPFIPSNEISSIFGNLVDGYFCLALSYSPYQIGTTILINETEIKRYASLKSISKSQLTDNGILYLINEDDNQIEAYYGANFRDGYRTPDFIYNTSSTPNIVSGTITDLHIASGYSSKYRNGNRIYVGTTQGVTRIEAYDKETDGYSDGYDSRGVSIHYGISGSGLQHEVIGGSVSNVVSVDSDDENGIMFVGTSDGYNGGITQISISTNRKIIFMTYSDGSLPSNNIKDIFGKAL